MLGFAQSACSKRSDDEPAHCGCAGSAASGSARRIVTERLLDQFFVVLSDCSAIAAAVACCAGTSCVLCAKTQVVPSPRAVPKSRPLNVHRRPCDDAPGRPRDGRGSNIPIPPLQPSNPSQIRYGPKPLRLFCKFPWQLYPSEHRNRPDPPAVSKCRRRPFGHALLAVEDTMFSARFGRLVAVSCFVFSRSSVRLRVARRRREQAARACHRYSAYRRSARSPIP